MNSSPPPPSFTLPPLRFPITPSPTPSPSAETPTVDVKGKAKAREAHDDVEGSRVSMYVRLFDGESPLHGRDGRVAETWSEMIRTVLASEEYLFTPREVWVLRRILALPCR